MEILSDISLVQWVFIGVGLLIALPPIASFFKGSVALPEISKKAASDTELTNLVRKWEELALCCESAGLNEACQHLDTVFPLLLKAREDDIKVEPETI